MFYNFCYNFYSRLITIGNFLQPFLLLALRLYWGYSFFQTGLGKLSDIDSIIVFFQKLEIPFPTISAYLAATTECIGGFCLLIGFASRLVAIPLIFTMVVAYLTAHIESLKTIFDDPQNFIKQTPFTYLLTALIIFVFGPGKLSFDYLLEKLFLKRKKTY